MNISKDKQQIVLLHWVNGKIKLIRSQDLIRKI
jgi:hypothetical protein